MYTNKYFYKKGKGETPGQAYYIPASRSFFSLIEKNYFKIFENTVNINKIIVNFGSLLEDSKDYFYEIMANSGKSFYSRNLEKILKENKKIKEFKDYMKKIFPELIKGEYIRIADKDFILNHFEKRAGGSLIPLYLASSGQQEVLPLFVVLLVRSIINYYEKDKIFIIEEPEAHLYIRSQNLMCNVFSYLANYLDSKIFVTTHNINILTYTNNMIEAHYAGIKDYNNKYNIVPLPFDKVSAYNIIDGVVQNIIDKEVNLITGGILEKEIEKIEYVYENIISMED